MVTGVQTCALPIFTGVYPNLAINPSKALVARGELEPALNAVATSTLAHTINIAWDDNTTDGNASPLDKTILIFYNASKHQSVYLSDLTDRAAGTQTATVPDSWSADSVACYLAFQQENNGEVSNSAYAGTVVVL
jgi:hypothetical protein